MTKANQKQKETEAKHLQWDAETVMEQLIMQESRHMQMQALVEHQLMFPDLTIKEFFAMASQELEDQDEELEDQDEQRENYYAEEED